MICPQCGSFDDRAYTTNCKDAFHSPPAPAPSAEKCPLHWPGDRLSCAACEKFWRSREPASPPEVREWWLDKSDGKFYEPGTDGVEDYIEVIEKSYADSLRRELSEANGKLQRHYEVALSAETRAQQMVKDRDRMRTTLERIARDYPDWNVGELAKRALGEK